MDFCLLLHCQILGHAARGHLATVQAHCVDHMLTLNCHHHHTKASSGVLVAIRCIQAVLTSENSEWVAVNPIAAGT